ncbi:MAG: hypothetical protein K1W20_11840 [Lachnospiraceae bacterium]
MLTMKYAKEQTVYEVSFRRISDHVIELQGDFPVKTKGFTLSRDETADEWDYKRFKTVYRKVDGGVQFSDDGSVYTAPPEPEPVPEPEPYVPTLEEVKEEKLREIGAACEQAVYAGVDVELPGGTEHFSLTEKDQINLFGKQAQMAAGAERFEYHQDGHPCRYYTKEEMMLIVETALGFVTFHTTYCNALNIWVSSLEDADAVNAVTYGCDVPEEYRSEVLKDILAARGAGNGEA